MMYNCQWKPLAPAGCIDILERLSSGHRTVLQIVDPLATHPLFRWVHIPARSPFGIIRQVANDADVEFLLEEAYARRVKEANDRPIELEISSKGQTILYETRKSIRTYIGGCGSI